MGLPPGGTLVMGCSGGNKQGNSLKLFVGPGWERSPPQEWGLISETSMPAGGEGELRDRFDGLDVKQLHPPFKDTRPPHAAPKDVEVEPAPPLKAKISGSLLDLSLDDHVELPAGVRLDKTLDLERILPDV